jgi:large subunit ribosomal protein L13
MKTTYFAKTGEIPAVHRLIDADGQILGRLATKVAGFLIGKGKPQYTPHVLSGDHVVVINASTVRVTGNKEKTKVYRHYTGYPGGLREIPMEKVRATHPERIVTEAVRRMLPKSRLGDKMLTRLRVYPGKGHFQGAQRPVETKI